MVDFKRRIWSSPWFLLSVPSGLAATRLSIYVPASRPILFSYATVQVVVSSVASTQVVDISDTITQVVVCSAIYGPLKSGITLNAEPE